MKDILCKMNSVGCAEDLGPDDHNNVVRPWNKIIDKKKEKIIDLRFRLLIFLYSLVIFKMSSFFIFYFFVHHCGVWEDKNRK